MAESKTINLNINKRNAKPSNKKKQNNKNKQAAKKGGPMNKAKYKPKVHNPINPVAIQTTFTNETLKLINMVCNPIHCTDPVKFTDGHPEPSMLLYDTFQVTEDFVTSTQTTTDVAPAATNTFLFYFHYGPTTIDIGTSLPYWLAVLPIDTITGKPILAYNELGNQFVTSYTFNNTAAILNSTGSSYCSDIRLISSGFRLMPKIDENTGAVSQFVTRYFAGSMQHSDFVNFVDQTKPQASVDAIIFDKDTDQYTNDYGASSRYNPFQDEDLIKYWNFSNLTTNSSAAPLNVTENQYPYVLVTFAQNISAAEEKEAEVPLYKRKRCGIRNLNPPKKYSQIVDQKLDEGGYSDNIANAVKRKSETIRKQIPTEDVYNWLYTLPIKFEIKLWIEGKLQAPSPLLMTCGTSDINFKNIGFWLQQNKQKMTSDGHSFSNVFRKINPKNVNKASKYASGMVGAVRKGSFGIMRSIKG